MKRIMKQGVIAPIVIAASAIAALTVATPAQAYPTSWYLTSSHNPTGAYYTAGTGYIRAWQECETSNGQTDWYNLGPWRGINTWSWTGSCTYYRGHGVDISN